MLHNLFNIISKNFRIVFRTPSLLFLVIIGPLTLILLVGTAFSSNVPDGAIIGLVADYNAPELDISIPTTPYGEKIICENHLIRGKLDACIYISGNVESEDPVIVEIIFDESRPQISQLIISEVQAFLGLTSEDISVQSTTELVNQLNEIIYFARDIEGDLDDFISESKKVQYSLNSAEQSLNNANRELDDQAQELINTRNDLDRINDDQLEDDERESYNNAISSLTEAENTLNEAINIINDSSIRNELIDARTDVINAKNDLNYYHNQFQYGITALRSARITIQNSLDRIYQVKSMIATELTKVQDAKSDALEAEKRLINIKNNLNEKLPDKDFNAAFAKKIANPIEVSLKSTLEDSATNIQLLFPLIAGTVVMFISILLGNILTLSEVHSPAFLRTVISPISRIWFILGIFITNIILVFFQMTVLFSTGAVNFNINIVENFWIFGGFVVLSIMTFTLIGILIAYLFNSEQTSILVATFTVLFFFLLSDAVFPVQLMPSFARFLASINPLMIFKELFRYSQFYKPNFLDVGWQLFLSGGYILAGFILVTLADFGFKKKNLK